MQGNAAHDEPKKDEMNSKMPTEEDLNRWKTNINRMLKEEENATQDTEQLLFVPYTDDPDREKRIAALQKLQRDVDDLTQYQEDLTQLIYDQDEIVPQIEDVVCNVNGKMVKEGWTHKKSKHFGVMRRRWTVLFDDTSNGYDFRLNTYEKYKGCGKPTESIVIDANTGIATKDDNEFIVSNVLTKQMFVFKVVDAKERDEWVRTLRSKGQKV